MLGAFVSGKWQRRQALFSIIYRLHLVIFFSLEGGSDKLHHRKPRFFTEYFGCIISSNEFRSFSNSFVK